MHGFRINLFKRKKKREEKRDLSPVPAAQLFPIPHAKAQRTPSTQRGKKGGERLLFARL
jgi:hypothetical protein